ncbi:hypothetical protein N7474_008539 [Penicillium riverlandense]|uniref:uncharacterized protein n=1 Tax=Penicillium riverlandense TaxID=1903569 RepID=UPI0025474F61|nr:uncharacterized protein N7474_008539 [Penicillium riverlandense]KAJ5812238.1 hypothetical protein N7474_008539 [Penicillium riverlandense]
MPGDDTHEHSLSAPQSPDALEAQSLLSDDVEPNSPSNPPRLASNGMRQSSISQPTTDGQRRTPRTMNHVRFDIDEDSAAAEDDHHSNGRAHSLDDELWLNEEDYELGDQGARGARHTGQAVPLLTDIEAPSVTLATSDDFFPEDHLENARPRSGMKMAFMNMANSIIGAGIIGQPYALRQAGMAMGILLLTALTITVDWTVRLIVVNSKLSGADSFQATMQYCFGKSGLIAISVAQWAFAFGGMVAFCIIVGDTIPHVMSALFPSLREMSFFWLLTDRRAVIVLFVLGVSYPLSLYRDIAKLAKASALALVSMIIIVITVITQGFRVPSHSRGEIKSHLIINSGFFQAVGVISFAFVCHHNSLLIYGSLKRPTLDRFTKVTHYSTGVSLIMCLAMGIAGFLSFGSKTQGNVLNNFPSNNIMVNIARFCFGLNMLTTLPLEAFVCRSVMTTYYFPDEPFNMNRHVIFTTALVVTSVIIALITCDLGSVFELIGATSAAALAYIFPPLCYIKLSGASRRAKIPAYACVAFGLIVMGVSFVQAIAKIISNKGGGETCAVFVSQAAVVVRPAITTKTSHTFPVCLPSSASTLRFLSPSHNTFTFFYIQSTPNPPFFHSYHHLDISRTTQEIPQKPISMDSEASERLRILQLADLGTARRERISTAHDPRKQVPVHLAYIEATRESNITGTKAQRLAEENKGQLEQWKNLHKTVNDTGDVEDLNDILQGQSHRAHLSASYGFLHTQGHGHHPMAVQSAGRGGGVMGTRGRELAHGSPRASYRGAASKPHPRASYASAVSVHLDPALDTNNGVAASAYRGKGYFRGNGVKERGHEGRKPVPVPRPTRPTTDYSRHVSTPQAFLASIHSPVQPSNLSPATATSPVQRPASVAITPEPKRPPPSFRPEISIPVTVPVNPKAKVTKAPAATTAPSAAIAKATQVSSMTIPSYPKSAEARATVRLPAMATAAAKPNPASPFAIIAATATANARPTLPSTPVAKLVAGALPAATARPTPPSAPVRKANVSAKPNPQMKYPVELLLTMQTKAERHRHAVLKSTAPEDKNKHAMQHLSARTFHDKKAASGSQAGQFQKAEPQEKARAAKEQASRTCVEVLQRQVAFLARVGAAQAPMAASRAGRTQRSDSEATSVDTSESAISYPKPMLPEKDNFTQSVSSGHLLDFEAEPMPQTELPEHVLSPALVDLTGLDFPKTRLHDTVEKEPSIPGTPSVSCEDIEQQTLSESVQDIERMLDPRLVAMSKLVDEFLKQMNDYRREFESHVTKALSSSGKSQSASHQVIATPQGSSPSVIMHTAPGSPVRAPTTPSMTKTDKITEMQKWLSQSGAISRDAAINHPSFSRYRSPVRIPSSGTDSPPDAQELPGTPLKTAFSGKIPSFDTLRVSESPDRTTHTRDPVKKSEPEPAVKGSTAEGTTVSETVPPGTSPKIKSPGDGQPKKRFNSMNKSIYATPGVPMYTGPPLYTAISQPIDQPLGQVTEFGKTKVLGVAPYNPSARVPSLSQRSQNISVRDITMPDAPEQTEPNQIGARSTSPPPSPYVGRTDQSTSASSGGLYQLMSSVPRKEENKPASGPTVLGPKPFTIAPASSSGGLYQPMSSVPRKEEKKVLSGPTVLGPKPFTIPPRKESKFALSRIFQ